MLLEQNDNIIQVGGDELIGKNTWETGKGNYASADGSNKSYVYVKSQKWVKKQLEKLDTPKLFKMDIDTTNYNPDSSYETKKKAYIESRQNNTKMFNAIICIIETSTDIKIHNVDSAYGVIVIIKINDAVDQSDLPDDKNSQFFQYYRSTSNVATIPPKTLLTHIILKLVFISDDPLTMPTVGSTTVGSTAVGSTAVGSTTVALSQPVSGESIRAITIEHMRNMIFGRKIPTGIIKHTNTHENVLNEVILQQNLFLYTVPAKAACWNIPVCPSILNFFWLNTVDSKAFLQMISEKSTDANTQNCIINNISGLTDNIQLGCIAMEFAHSINTEVVSSTATTSDSPDNFITLNQCLSEHPYTTTTTTTFYQNVYISLITNMLRMFDYKDDATPEPIIHLDLHANNIFVNIKYLHDNVLLDSTQNDNLRIYTYILDFGKCIQLTGSSERTPTYTVKQSNNITHDQLTQINTQLSGVKTILVNLLATTSADDFKTNCIAPIIALYNTIYTTIGALEKLKWLTTIQPTSAIENIVNNFYNSIVGTDCNGILNDDSNVYSINRQSYDNDKNNRLKLKQYTQATNITPPSLAMGAPAPAPAAPTTTTTATAAPAADESNLIAKYDAAILQKAMSKALTIATAFTTMLTNNKKQEAELETVETKRKNTIASAHIQITKTKNLNEINQTIENKYLTLNGNEFEES